MTSETQQQSRAAVALKYDGEKAPTISATGTHELAEEIIRIAREHNVPLYENAELAS
ncbi:MAG TPA: flagellar protein FhlB, partial [Marinobacter adhaerens]|nr:flagellar protein FhlB [Marinobacter adhaerens]